MAFNAILFAITITILQSSISAQTTTTSFFQSTTPASWLNPFTDGKWGNPGARIHLSNKSIDAVHAYASTLIGRALELTSLVDLELNTGNGMLYIRPPRISEAKFAGTENELIPPNRIRSRFFGGKISATGVWQFKKQGSNSVSGGSYKATITNIEVNATTQLGRSYDGKPMANLVECKADLSQHRIEIEGAPETKVVENCNMSVCDKIRGFFEDVVCKMVNNFVKDVVNKELQDFPIRQPIYCDMHKMDYSLLSNEPKVMDYCVQAGLEGRYMIRGASAVPFSPSPLNWVDRGRMFSFQMGDFTFNTLLHQTHISGYKFSTADLLENSATIQQSLRLNCSEKVLITSSIGVARRVTSRGGQPSTRLVQCLGQLFENFTNFGPYERNDTGEIVYRCSQKPKAVYLQSQKTGFFDGSNGALEIFGPAGQDGGRKLLARADVRLLRGDFMPKLNGVNITATVKVVTLQLAQPQSRMITDEWLDRLAQFVTPIATELINAFFDRYGQFPVPLPRSFVCASPDFLISPRTMQVDCDIRQSPKAGAARFRCMGNACVGSP